MIALRNNQVQVSTGADAEDWSIRLRYRLMILSAAAANPNNGPAILEAISSEIDFMLEMIPDEAQMKKALVTEK